MPEALEALKKALKNEEACRRFEQSCSAEHPKWNAVQKKQTYKIDKSKIKCQRWVY